MQTDLKLTTTNGSDIPYHGWAKINFQVTPRTPVLNVPFLVRQETSNPPLIGYNTIEESTYLDPTIANPETLGETFPDVKREKFDTLISFIKTDCRETELCSVKTNKRDYVVPKKTSTIVSCRGNHGPIDKSTPVRFEPDKLAPWPSGLIIQETLVALKPEKSNVIKVEVINSTEHDITLLNRTYIHTYIHTYIQFLFIQSYPLHSRWVLNRALCLKRSQLKQKENLIQLYYYN